MSLIPNRKLYLCPPDFLELESAAINPWMDMTQEFSRKKALEQWQNLVNIYWNLVPESVEIVPPQEGITELCFFGDSIFAYRDKAVFSRFAKAERVAETEFVMEFMREKFQKTARVPEGMHYEGSGETVLWRDKILVGHGNRSDSGVADFLQQHFELEVVALKLSDSAFYHLDLAFFPISDTLIAVYEDAFSTESKEKIKNLGAEILYVKKSDIENYALNSIALGNNVVMHSEAENFANILRDRGFTVYPVDISEFFKFGGGIKCLTFQRYL